MKRGRHGTETRSESWRLFDRFYEENEDVTHLEQFAEHLAGPPDRAALAAYAASKTDHARELMHAAYDVTEPDRYLAEAEAIYIQSFAEHLRYVGVPEFYAARDAACAKFMSAMEANPEPSPVVLVVNGPATKSYLWVALLCWPRIRHLINVVASDPRSLPPAQDYTLVFIDDAVYTGSQATENIMDVVHQLRGIKVNMYMISMATATTGRLQLQRIPNLRHIYGLMMSPLTEDDPAAYDTFYSLVLAGVKHPDASATHRTAFELLDSNWDRPAIYFAHKIADEVSLGRMLGGGVVLDVRERRPPGWKPYLFLHGGGYHSPIYKQYGYTANGYLLMDTNETDLMDVITSLYHEAPDGSGDLRRRKRARLQALLRVGAPMCRHCGLQRATLAALASNIPYCSHDCYYAHHKH